MDNQPEPQKPLSDEEQIAKMKDMLVMGLVIVVVVAAIFAFIIYKKMSNNG